MFFFGRTLGSVISAGIALVLIVVAGAWLYDLGVTDLRRRLGVGDKGSSGGSSAKQRATQTDTFVSVDRESSWAKSMELTAQEVRTGLTELDQAMATWAGRVTELQHSETGRRIAANKERCEQFAAVIDKDRPTGQDAAQLRARLDELTKFVNDALAAHQRSTASDALPNQAKRLVNDVRAAVRAYQEHLAVLDALAAFTKDSPPASKTLAEALDDLKLAEADRRAQKLAASRLSAQEQAERALEKARLEKEKREQDFERAYAAMKSYVLPFTTATTTQLDTNGFKPSANKGPVSWTALQRFLKQDERTGARLCQLVAGAKDRPRGMFPAHHPYTPRIDMVTVYKVQQFLTDYGDMMVAKGILAP